MGDEACKRVKDSMPTPESFFVPQDNTALENKVYTQVFGPDNYGKMLGYGRGMTKSRLFSYGSAKFMDKMDAHEKKYRLSSTSVWQRECQ
ncbi:hypothetical protein Golob_027990, partial [Gossypium lobatum]|nr:hypothetical protein [Gossypium lobatum]